MMRLDRGQVPKMPPVKLQLLYREPALTSNAFSLLKAGMHWEKVEAKMGGFGFLEGMAISREPFLMELGFGTMRHCHERSLSGKR